MTASEAQLRMRLITVEGAADEAQEDLLARLRRGEPAAVAQVYDLHHRSIRAFARRLVGDEMVAEDLVHETFVALPRAIQNFKGDSSLRTFLVGIAVNYARHYVRAASRRREALDKMARESTPPSPDPEHSLGRAELADLLSRALDKLPIEQRVAFVLCEVEERSSPEVAEIVGVPEATVRTRLYHAKQKLRSMLEKEGLR